MQTERMRLDNVIAGMTSQYASAYCIVIYLRKLKCFPRNHGCIATKRKEGPRLRAPSSIGARRRSTHGFTNGLRGEGLSLNRIKAASRDLNRFNFPLHFSLFLFSRGTRIKFGFCKLKQQRRRRRSACTPPSSG